MKKISLLFFILVGLQSLSAQLVLKEKGSWHTLSNKFTLSENLYISNIAQMRRVDFLDNIQAIMIKPALNYKFSKNITAGFGYVLYKTYPNGVHHASIKKNEHRLWQHITLSSTLSKMKLSNRFVFEERFKDVINKETSPHTIDGTSYAQRFRYRILLSFNAFNISNGHQILGKISDEIRIRFASGLSDPDFDQNNLRISFGTKITKNTKFWLGYGRDYFKVNSDKYVRNNLLTTTINYDLDLSKKAR